MKDLNRRLFLAGSAAAPIAVASAAPSLAAGPAGITLQEALEGRQSVRRFGTAPLPEDQLLRLLWAANGVNRPETGGRTAPSWRSAYDTDLHVATAEGVFLHQPGTNTLERVLDRDIRAEASDSAFVARAPALLIYVSDGARLRTAAEGADDQALAVGAHVNAAVTAQNVYLACVAEGLGTCLIGGAANRDVIAAALSLAEGSIVTYVQPVGVPR
ncbi:nitroreductase family protein [Pseudogemmobacter sonorensis]|uniref:nitroreductase family protein n=1 Tax=Pseudogemmobacter sonorensis TaxID=2989681 RepID=UPI0036A85806